MSSNISIFNQDTDFLPTEQESLIGWLELIASKYKHKISELNYIFTTDENLNKLNVQYLKHDDFTDILTFPHEESSPKIIKGDIYISIDRVKENAAALEVNFIDELHRVMVHGLLHLIGFYDSDKKSKLEMRKEEDLSLSLRMF